MFSYSHYKQYLFKHFELENKNEDLAKNELSINLGFAIWKSTGRHIADAIFSQNKLEDYNKYLILIGRRWP